MFIEPDITGSRRGWIEVVCGSMFSGKTEELIRRLKRVQFANLKAEIFKPAVDTRYGEAAIVSHDTNAIPSTPIENSQQMLLLAAQADVVGVDEAQFFDNELPDVCDRLAYLGKRVIVAGLDMDYTGKPFGSMPMILAKADYITKLHAICMRCGNIANYSHRKIPNQEQVMLGAVDVYEPLCRKCYNEAQR